MKEVEEVKETEGGEWDDGLQLTVDSKKTEGVGRADGAGGADGVEKIFRGRKKRAGASAEGPRNPGYPARLRSERARNL